MPTKEWMIKNKQDTQKVHHYNNQTKYTFRWINLTNYLKVHSKNSAHQFYYIILLTFIINMAIFINIQKDTPENTPPNKISSELILLFPNTLQKLYTPVLSHNPTDLHNSPGHPHQY